MIRETTFNLEILDIVIFLKLSNYLSKTGTSSKGVNLSFHTSQIFLRLIKNSRLF